MKHAFRHGTVVTLLAGFLAGAAPAAPADADGGVTFTQACDGVLLPLHANCHAVEVHRTGVFPSLPGGYGPADLQSAYNAPGGFDNYSMRVPLIVVSPYSKPHFVSHTPRDYTAILAFIEKTFNIPALSARDAFWQDPSRDMSEFFDFSAANLLNAPNGTPWTQFLPAQPTGALCDRTKEAGPTF